MIKFSASLEREGTGASSKRFYRFFLRRMHLARKISSASVFGFYRACCSYWLPRQTKITDMCNRKIKIFSRFSGTSFPWTFESINHISANALYSFRWSVFALRRHSADMSEMVTCVCNCQSNSVEWNQGKCRDCLRRLLDWQLKWSLTTSLVKCFQRDSSRILLIKEAMRVS